MIGDEIGEAPAKGKDLAEILLIPVFSVPRCAGLLFQPKLLISSDGCLW